jgi:hypothetical protein
MTKSDRIDALRAKTITVTHRAELIDQGSAYPAHVVTPPGRIKWPEGTIVTVDHAESPVKRWSMCGDARVRPEHRNINHDYGKMAGTPDPWRDTTHYRVPYAQMMGRGLRALPGYAQGLKGDRQYQVSPFGKKFRTRVYVRGSWAGTMYSKRRKTAIHKGETWLSNT